MKKKTVWFAVSLLVVLGLLVGGFGCVKEEAPAPTPAPTPTSTPIPTPAPSPTAKPIVLKYTSHMPGGADTGIVDQWWGEELEKRTNGRVKVEYYFSQSLVKAASVVEAVKAGIADIGLTVSAYTPTLMPMTTLFELCFVTEKMDAAVKAAYDLYEEFPAYREEFEKSNMRPLHFHGIPPTTVAGTGTPVRTLEDIKGKKYRGVAHLGHVHDLLGGTAVSISAGEVYGAMEKGLIQGYWGIPLTYVVALKLSEVSDWVCDPRVGVYHMDVVCMNLDAWNEVSPEDQQIMKELSAQVPERYLDIIMEKEEAAWKACEEGGIELYRLSAAEAERWRDACLPQLWDEETAKVEETVGPVAGEFFNRYLELVEKYEPQARYVHVYEKHLGK